MHRVIRESTRAREFDVIGAQHFQHLGAHQPQDQRHLEQAQRNRGQYQCLQAADGQKTGRPQTKLDSIAAPERGQPSQPHRENQDQENTDQKRRQRNADERNREDKF